MLQKMYIFRMCASSMSHNIGKRSNGIETYYLLIGIFKSDLVKSSH